MGLNHVDEGTQKELHLLAHLYPEHSIQHVFAVHKGLKAVVVRWRVNQLRVPCEVTACFQGFQHELSPCSCSVSMLQSAAELKTLKEPCRPTSTLVHVTPVETTREALLSETCLKHTLRQPSTLTFLQAARTADAATARVLNMLRSTSPALPKKDVVSLDSRQENLY